MKNVIVKSRKINDVSGNIAYLCNRDEHPDVCFVASTCSRELWDEYAAVNQKEFKASGKADVGRCVEARELIYVFPNEFYNLDHVKKGKLTRAFAKHWKDTYGLNCVVAMHGNDKDYKNLHLHVMYMERVKVDKELKIAPRRLYFNERGRQVKSKKDVLGEDGQLRPGCSFVKKGEQYGEKEWTSKKQYFHSNKFTADTKQFWASYLNKAREMPFALGWGMEERAVYDRDNSPFLPMQELINPLRYRDAEKQKLSIAKAEEVNKDIRDCNDLRTLYNDCVEYLIERGADVQALVSTRKLVSRNIIQALENGKPHQIKDIINNGIGILERENERMTLKTQNRKPTLSEMIAFGIDSGGMKPELRDQQSKTKSRDDDWER